MENLKIHWTVIFTQNLNSIKKPENQSKYILIIHGKGLNNKEGVAPLKRLVQKLIINCDIAMASTSAGIKDGGYGATYVLLKSSYI